MNFDFPILSFMIWFPVLGGIYIATQKRTSGNIKIEALSIAIICFISSLLALVYFDNNSANMQFVERYSWIPVFNIEYLLGVDGISLPLIILTTFTTILVICAGWSVISERPHLYMGSFLVLEGIMIGVFAALDAALFYVFWEAMLIPMFLIIGIWGGQNRVYATIKFFLYTLLGSLLMLVALLYLYGETGVFSIESMHNAQLDMIEQKLIFLAFLLAFAVKVPMWPVHTWLPDAHVEAPTAGSMILAGVLLKMGGYGFLRFSLPMFPFASEFFAPMIFLLSVVAVIYTSLVALAQSDMKKMIAYSSVAHMGFVTIGIFSMNEQGIAGAMFQMISHGLVSAALFFCVGVVYDRLHTREISAYGGVTTVMPRYAVFFMFMMLASVGLPGTSGFVGEMLVLVGAWQANTWLALFAATGLVLGATYMLWLYRRVMFGQVVSAEVQSMERMQMREYGIFLPLTILVLFFGVYPMALLDVMDVSIQIILDDLTASGVALLAAR